MNRALVTGSAGHLGEALCLTLAKHAVEYLGVDIKSSPYTDLTGSIADANFVTQCMQGIDTVFHAATLHKPHVATHSKQDFIDTNITGTQNLLQAAIDSGVNRFVFTSTTSVFGHVLRPPAGEPAMWVNEELTPVPKNIYGMTKFAAENLCRLAHEESGLNCLILRTSRFFPEDDDSIAIRSSFSNDNSKANEYLNRRVELEDVVSAHLLAAERAGEIRFGRFIISATSPFSPDDLHALNEYAPAVVARYFPDYQKIYGQLGWKMFERLDRVYVNTMARKELGWTPRHSFGSVLASLQEKGEMPRSDLSLQVGAKGYHDQLFDNEPYPV